jgi:hypothetical protein
MIKPTRVLMDKQAERFYYIDSQNNAYSDNRFLKRVKCGRGHKMWSSGAFMICEPCDVKIECKIIT